MFFQLDIVYTGMFIQRINFLKREEATNALDQITSGVDLAGDSCLIVSPSGRWLVNLRHVICAHVIDLAESQRISQSLEDARLAEQDPASSRSLS